jgi:putative membrane protein insertion efficiency factor
MISAVSQFTPASPVATAAVSPVQKPLSVAAAQYRSDRFLSGHVNFGCGAKQGAEPRDLPPTKLTDVNWDDPSIKNADAITKALLYGIRQYQLWTRKPENADLNTADVTGHEHNINAKRNWLGSKVSAGCRYYPTCSQYGVQALVKYGWLKGSLKTAKRVFWDCSPFKFIWQGKSLKDFINTPPRSIDDPV